MHVFSHRSLIIAEFIMLVLILVITGCGGGDGDHANATISGQVALPPNSTNLGGGGGGGVPVANTQFTTVDFEKPNANDTSMTGFQTIGSGTTDSTGKFVLTTPQTSAAAVIANGPQPSGPQQGKVVPISGLMNLKQDTVSKNFDGATTIACFAGLGAISQGNITPQQLDAQRISNLEQVAAGFVATTNFLDTNDIVRSADAVRQQTDNGAHL
jgi:hypothetical protein